MPWLDQPDYRLEAHASSLQRSAVESHDSTETSRTRAAATATVAPWAALVPTNFFESQDKLCLQLAAITRRIEALTATPGPRAHDGTQGATPSPTRRTLEPSSWPSCASFAGEAVKVRAMNPRASP